MFQFHLQIEKITTDLYVKAAGKGILYSQALRLNRICSDPISFDRRCNDLEKWLTERGYC